MEWAYIGVCILANVVIIYILISFIFPGDGDLAEAIGYFFTPDTWSMMKGEWGNDFLASMKLAVLFFLIGGLLYGELLLGTDVLGLDLSSVIPFVSYFIPEELNEIGNSGSLSSPSTGS